MRKSKAPLFSEKFLIQSALTLISSLLLIGTALFHDALWIKPTPVAEETPKFLSNQTGDQLENAYISAISNAKKSVLLLIFSMTSEEVIDALRQKSQEGVPVKVICDAKACPYISKKLGPQVELIRRLGKGLMHIKILVIDDIECWIGSANFTSESLNMHGNLVVALKNEALAATIKEKASTLHEYDRKGEVTHHTYLAGDQELQISFLPDDKKASVRIKQLIREAKKSIRIAMFTWTRFDMAKEVVEAQKRGVNVEVVLDRSSSNGASAKIAEMLKSHRVKLFYSAGTALLHHKFMWLDDHTLEVGSANWTKAAFTQNDDCFLVLHPLTHEQRQHMQNLWQAIKADSIR
ncbi:hypothetical protein DB42_CE00190 [Neochlamydia sp. EPS4]|uniref:phospholipase D-like domain-containing protein n=1 Tax=Neochlamydia sp. EPS4 TaxID=1478175 RepID=UPI000583CC12|nr:phosphatidylserine/phosphatidylglycerophosphate/cardiolipin synthase family protein [Neochlamydia sp. EPS4]KIC73214.1 hypothetical protein DB42_CE00190 [Neochlamydia sp. EPS4]